MNHSLVTDVMESRTATDMMMMLRIQPLGSMVPRPAPRNTSRICFFTFCVLDVLVTGTNPFCAAGEAEAFRSSRVKLVVFVVVVVVFNCKKRFDFTFC